MLELKERSVTFEGGGAVAPEGGESAPSEADKMKDKSDLPKDMSNGPVENRECTDLICCLIFLAFLVGMVGVSGYGLVYGDPNRFLIMWDADGRGCGNDTAAIDYPYLYFPMINLTEIQGATDNPKAAMKELLKYGTCVKECPLETGTVECLKPTYMINNEYYSYEQCTYSILVPYVDPVSNKEKKKRVFDVRYPTEV